MKSIKIKPEVKELIEEMRYTSVFIEISDKLLNQASKPGKDVISIDDQNISVELLIDVLGDNLFYEDDLEDYVFIFKSKSKNRKNSKNKNTILPINLKDNFIFLMEYLYDYHENIVMSILELEFKSPNPLNIESIDIGDDVGYFNIYQKGNKRSIKITTFINKYFPNLFMDNEIQDFIKDYNSLIGDLNPKIGESITPRPFKFDPKNVRETFLSLVTETYPMGHEDEVVKFITPGLKKDKYGNYYKIIGNSDCSFTCHLDTVSMKKSKVNLKSFIKDGDEFIITDGTSILGADDKAGVSIIMYMIAHNVPGVYWFFMGEERGGIGSGKVLNDLESYPFMKDIKKMISFDRRNYFSVITRQTGSTCCSNEFAESLCKEFNKSGLNLNLDPTGVFTDSAQFIDVIPECTNVSVGYFKEHTHEEMQNITFLEKLAKACIRVNWSDLVVSRKIGIEDHLLKKWGSLIKDIRKNKFSNFVRARSTNQKPMGVRYYTPSGIPKLSIDLTLRYDDIESLYDDMEELQNILTSHKINPDINFDDGSIKIELD